MKQFTHFPSEVELLTAAGEWIELLAGQHWAEAMDFFMLIEGIRSADYPHDAFDRLLLQSTPTDTLALDDMQFAQPAGGVSFQEYSVDSPPIVNGSVRRVAWFEFSVAVGPDWDDVTASCEVYHFGTDSVFTLGLAQVYY